jgi:hypothetical protein
MSYAATRLRCVLCSIFCQGRQQVDRQRAVRRDLERPRRLGPGDVHRPYGGGVFETKAPPPPGNEARGYFNIHGENPLGGHLRIARCAAIYFIDRPFFGRRSCSLQFVNLDGGVVGRRDACILKAGAFTRRLLRCASFPLVGGQRRGSRRASDGAFDNLLDPRDPHKRGRGADGIDSPKCSALVL